MLDRGCELWRSRNYFMGVMPKTCTNGPGPLARAVLLIFSVLTLAVMSCESGNEPSSIAGTWVATSFVFTEVGEPPADVLAMGGSLSITIASTNATTGTMTIPGALVGGSDITLNMAGTARRTGNTIEFDQAADSFVRDIPWTFTGNTLRGTRSDAGVTVDITLTRQ
jgi:hypothetical protein